MNRYTRQTCLPEIGNSGQLCLENAHVLIVGVGGLGCAALPYLAGAGVGKMTLIDPDTVSESNLHRQVLYKEADIGNPKVACARDWVSQHNAALEVETHFSALSPEDADKLCDQADIVLDCADSFAVSYTLSDACMRTRTPLISASVLAFAGYVGGFCGTRPSLRAVFPDLPAQAQSCASAGVMGPVVGVLGCLQAQFALNTLLAIEPSPVGQLLSVDLKNLQQSGFRFDSASEPPTQDALTFISPRDITQEDWVVDVRDGMTETSRQSDAIVQHFSLDDFRTRQYKPDEHRRAVIVCRTGLTAWRAARLLQTYWQGDIRLIAMGNAPL
ncbi:hypothetical protein AltI4_37420 [Alteromonas sp. I4]|nr:hypothetical protein AltI4_37420 [Alteromonas sp. I4]